LVLVAIGLAACAAAPEASEETYRGTMTSGCAPHDAPSTVLELESADGESSVAFNLWPAEGVVPPTTIAFDAQHAVGQGAYCASPGICEPALSGRVSIEGAGATEGVQGEWSLELEDGQTFAGRFSADWLAIQALCG
jgi:hypothetical protein